MTETINSRFFLLVTGKSIAEKPHNRINFQDMQLVSLRLVFVSILIFVRSGAGVRCDQSRHLVFMKTIRQSGKLTRDRNQFSRDVSGRDFFFIFQWILYADFIVYYKEVNLNFKVPRRFCLRFNVLHVITEGRNMVLNPLHALGFFGTYAISGQSLSWEILLYTCS